MDRRSVFQALPFFGVAVAVPGSTKATASIDAQIAHHLDMAKLLIQQKDPTIRSWVDVSPGPECVGHGTLLLIAERGRAA